MTMDLLERRMAQRAKQPTMRVSGVPFPPEADGEFDVVSDAEISEWRDRLNHRFGIGQGKLRVVDDPVHAG